MIFRQFDLAIDFEEVDELLDDPYVYPIELNVDCSAIGYATLLVRANKMDFPRTIKRKRQFRRFLLFAGRNEEMMEIMTDENNRVLNRYDFFTEQGSVVILDYEMNRE